VSELQPDDPGYFEREQYRAAGAKAIMDNGGMAQRLIDINRVATDAAVKYDRTRMAEMMRNRAINLRAPMEITKIMFDIAEDIEQGSPMRPGEKPA
jgi:hypothetical protein